MPDLDIRILIGGGVVLLLLVILLVARSKKKPAETEAPVHVPPNPFDKPPTSGPVSSPGPISGQGPVSGPISTPLGAGPVSGPISTPGGAPPTSGPISSPGTSGAAASDVDALLVTDGGTQAMPRPPEPAPPPPMRPIEQEDDLATQALDRPPVSLDEESAATEDAAAAKAKSEPPPPPPAPSPVFPPPAEPVVAKPAPPKAPPAKPASDPALKAPPPPAPVASKQTTPATPQAMTDAMKRQEPARPKLPSKPEVPQDAELDFSALRDAKKSDAKLAAAASAATAPAAVEAKAPAPSAATSPAARFVPASNPETAELEKGDPRHAAARRLARLSVSEIKLYHEGEVKEGREKKDLWKRLIADITLASQTYEKRVDREVRDRFDYLYDEILRQLAEGNADLLGADAPKPKAKAKAEEPKAEKIEKVEVEKAEEKPASAPQPIAPESSKATAPAITKRVVEPTSPETAELEKSDPRHAAARRLARLSVSEIKLYHEAEVKEGREKKDLYTRLGADISLAKQTYEKRVDQEVRDRFDYLYDEILRQLAEGNADLLGRDAPPPPKPAAKVEAPAPKPAEPPKPAEAPKPEPAKVEAPKSEPKIEAPKPAEPVKPTMPGVKYAPPSNPETAELEKGDPRHAAARRLARLSVSEIKLYHEAEVKEGREKKDLYTRLGADISLAKQTYEKRVDQEVRDRFDYLYDEIVRQLAEGNAELLGKDAPPPPKPAAKIEAKVEAKVEAPKPVEAPAPEPPKVEAPPPEPKKEEAPKEEPKAAAASPAAPAAPAAPAPSQATQPSAIAAKYMAPSNPKTAELEKADPRHAAARRLARLSVSEIKLYHEAEVKEGREKKDLYTRLGADIALAKQTFEKRVDQEVRDRFDYLYDEIVRQLAEGNEDLLGPGAPPKPAGNA